MILVRSMIFQVVFYTTFILLMLLGAPCLFLPRRATMRLVRTWAWVSVKLLAVICGTRLEFRHLERLPKGAALLAVKHQSFLETFALILVLDDFSFILKKELTAIPFFGWYTRAAGQIALDRSRRGATIAGLQRSVRACLAAGRQVVIFPEGTRRPVGAPPAYKTGVSAIVTDSGVPCIPVALNSGVFWPRRGILRRPGTIVFDFLPPIEPGLGKRAFMAALEAAIEPATDALVAEALANDASLRTVVPQPAASRCADKAGNSPAPA